MSRQMKQKESSMKLYTYEHYKHIEALYSEYLQNRINEQTLQLGKSDVMKYYTDIYFSNHIDKYIAWCYEIATDFDCEDFETSIKVMKSRNVWVQFMNDHFYDACNEWDELQNKNKAEDYAMCGGEYEF